MHRNAPSRMDAAETARCRCLRLSPALPPLANAGGSPWQISIINFPCLSTPGFCDLQESMAATGTIHAACDAGDVAAVSRLLEAVPVLAWEVEVDQNNWLPLHVAAGSGHEAVVRLLLEAAPTAAMAADQRGALTRLHRRCSACSLPSRRACAPPRCACTAMACQVLWQSSS